MRSRSATCPERRPAPRQHGFTLVTVVFLLVEFALLGAALASVAWRQQLGSAMEVDQARGLQAARAGLEWAAFQMLRNPAPPAAALRAANPVGPFAAAFDMASTVGGASVPVAAISFGNLRRTLTASGHSGTVDVALALGSSATDTSCLQPWTPATGDAATAGANLAFLRGARCSSGWGNDPAVRASFGAPRTQVFSIYRRENH